MRIDIRPAALADIDGMTRVVDSAWRENFKDIFSAEFIAKYTGDYCRDNFILALSFGNDIFVLLCDGEIIAVCVARACFEKLFEEYAEITLLYVLPEWQRKGIGKKLLSHTLRKMRGKGCKGAVLYTPEKNTSARKFYEKFGFTLGKNTLSRKFENVKLAFYTIDF